MSAPATAQNNMQLNLASLLQQLPYKNLLRPEQITVQQFPFLTEAELQSFPTGVRTFWNAIATKPAEDPTHQQALAKLQQLTQTVLRKYQVYKAQIQRNQQLNQQQQQQTQQQPQAQQQQQQSQQQQQQNQQIQQQQQAQQQTQTQDVARPMSQGQQGQPQNQSHTPLQQSQQQVPSQPQQPSAQVAQQNGNTQAAQQPGQQQTNQNVSAQPGNPNPLSTIDPDQFMEQLRTRYEKATVQQKAAREQLSKIDQYMQTARASGKDIPNEVLIQRKRCTDQIQESQKIIDFVQSKLRNDSTGALNPRNAGEQANSQNVAQAPQIRMPAMPTNPAVLTAQQQQISRPMSPANPGQAGQSQLPQHMPQSGTIPQGQGQAPFARPGLNPTQPNSMAQAQSQASQSLLPSGMQSSPAPLSQQAAIQASQRSYSSLPQTLPQSVVAGPGSRPDLDKNNNRQWPMNKGWVPTTPTPVSMAAARPTLTGPNNGPMGMMGQPALQKQPPFLLQGPGDRVLDKKKLDELVRQVTGGSGEGLHPEVEESVLQLADEFIDNVITSACKLAKLRGSSSLEVKDIQMVLERQYNIRVPGYATDEIRTVRKIQPATGYLQKMNAVQAAKVMGGKTDI